MDWFGCTYFLVIWFVFLLLLFFFVVFWCYNGIFCALLSSLNSYLSLSHTIFGCCRIPRSLYCAYDWNESFLWTCHNLTSTGSRLYFQVTHSGSIVSHPSSIFFVCLGSLLWVYHLGLVAGFSLTFVSKESSYSESCLSRVETLVGSHRMHFCIPLWCVV